MQQRGDNSIELESGDQMIPSQSRRNNIKSKFLVRSHAMREEASPPRESISGHCSPAIKLTTSDTGHLSVATSPNRFVITLSPSASRVTSPMYSPNNSPTSTLVSSSPVPHGPSMTQQLHHHYHQSAETEFTEIECSSPKVNRMNRQNLEQRFNNNRTSLHKTDIIVEETSQADAKHKCDCMNHNCGNCLRHQERNYNNNFSGSNNNVTNNTLTVSRSNTRKLRQQSSSQGSFDSSSISPCLSRDNSSEQYTDTTGVDLEIFIPETLNRNAKDRALMLRIEEELVQLAKDKLKTHFKFPPMSSYQRMLVHRCAAYFGMDHNIESSGKCVVVNKTKNTRIPDVEFQTHIKEDIVFTEEPRRSILKRDSNSIEDYGFKSPDRQCSLESRRSKSFEEREEEYEKVRRRIFNKGMHDCSSADEFGWPDEAWSSTEGDSRMRFGHSANEHHYRLGRSSGRLIKVQSEEVSDATLRPHVAKSYSFGGYAGVLSRGDSVFSTHSAGPRLLTKQDSAASSVSWRLSPSSSGYKTQSQRSESITPSPTSTPYLSGDTTRQDSTNSTNTNASDAHEENEIAQFVWAVTNINHLSKGSVIINPQTGQPVKNQDGSIYHYDPENPLPELQMNPSNSKPPPSPVKMTAKPQRDRPSSPKKRSRHSPVKKTNTATSPCLPYTPPPLVGNRHYLPPNLNENVQAPPPQQFPYPASYTPDTSVPVYQPPCIVFAPYNQPVPMQYDGRMESQEIGYYNLPDGISPPGPAGTYQTAPPQMWSQPSLTYYQNTPPPNASARFSVPIQQGTYITQYAPNYLPPQNIPQPPPDMFPQTSVSIMYPVPPNQSNMVPYPPYNQTNQMYPQIYPNVTYPPNTPTPSSCTSSVSNTPFHGQIYDPNLGQVVQNMAQMSISAPLPPPPPQQPLKENRNIPKGKYNGSKGTNSSQSSSTETNSSSMTMIAGYCPAPGIYKPPLPESPGLSYSGNYGPVLYRQMGQVETSTPIINKGSRSPAIANEVHLERQRYGLTAPPPPQPPPIMYQTMPYPIQPDNRIMPCRGQATAYRHYRQPNPNPNSDNRNNHKNRRSRGNKPTNLPPNGKQH